MKKLVGKNGRTWFVPTIAECQSVIESDNSAGWCIACGAECDGIEPDAHKDECEVCARRTVYGAEQLVLMGLVYTGATAESVA